MHTTLAPTARRLPLATDVLRTVLTVNAATSVAGGAAALLFGGPVADLLGTGAVGWVRTVAAGLALFGLAVWTLARSSAPTRARWTPVVSAVDAAWVAGTIAAVASGWFSTRGAWVMGAVAVAVLDLAVAQVWSARRSAC